MNIQDVVDFSQANTAAERYRPAAEKILKGDPEQTVYNHYNSPCGQMNAGVWEGEAGQWKVNYTEHEYCEIVQGVSVLRDADGNAKTLRAGDRFVAPLALEVAVFVAGRQGHHVAVARHPTRPIEDAAGVPEERSL